MWAGEDPEDIVTALHVVNQERKDQKDAAGQD